MPQSAVQKDRREQPPPLPLRGQRPVVSAPTEVGLPGNTAPSPTYDHDECEYQHIHGDQRLCDPWTYATCVQATRELLQCLPFLVEGRCSLRRQSAEQI